jgi:DNA-binding XRE family transcriptional regulator
MRHIGVSSAAYDALEDGYQRPNATALYKLATLFKCKLSDFFLDDLDGVGRVGGPTPS